MNTGRKEHDLIGLSACSFDSLIDYFIDYKAVKHAIAPKRIPGAFAAAIG